MKGNLCITFPSGYFKLGLHNLRSLEFYLGVTWRAHFPDGRGSISWVQSIKCRI